MTLQLTTENDIIITTGDNLFLIVDANTFVSTVDISKTFEWYVEESLQVSKTFEWRVGEGPLFWFRIEWKSPTCPPNDCTPGVSVCTVSETACDKCDDVPPCMPCKETYGEYWYMMATSVEHLCERINSELCYRPAPGVFKTVKMYDRPVLCCDVEKFLEEGITITDSYVDVGFCLCACVNLVDPCDCGDIQAPCDTPQPPDALNLFGLPRQLMPTISGFAIEPLSVHKPKKDNIPTKCNCVLPNTLAINHNLENLSVLKDFLKRYKKVISPNLKLLYDNNSWQKKVHLTGGGEQWVILLEWKCGDDTKHGEYNWIFQTHIQHIFGNKKKNTRIMIEFATYGTLNEEGLLGINFNFNTNTEVVAVTQPVMVKSKKIYDEIGVFGGFWWKDPYLKFKINA